MPVQPRHVVIGTAGHIDHGKSTLVAALTGTDPDRLPEEQERGITIDLGFAHTQAAEDLVLSFVDVPGHERFVKNMLAGAGGVDLVLLVVAADESVMPQTREHFHICRLLGAPRGVIALTKTDLVEPDLVDLVRLEVEDMVAGSFLEQAPITPVSSTTGEGVDGLRKALEEAAREAMRADDRAPEGPFRLPVDRVFSLHGFGTVVTGTALSGRVRTGDRLQVLPSGGSVKVRGLQVHGEDAPEAWAGQRVALNLQGISREEIERGDWLATPDRYQPRSILDAVLEILPSAPAPLEDMDRVRFHLGARESLARVRVLEESGVLAPGDGGRVQIRLEAPLHAVAGERFVLRRYSPITTIGGGRILDPAPPKRAGLDSAGAREWKALASLEPQRMIETWVEREGARGLDREALASRTGWPLARLQEAEEALVAGGILRAAGPRLLAAGAWNRLVEEAQTRLAEYHQAHPLSPGMGGAELRSLLGLDEEPFRAWLEQCVEEKLLVREGEAVRRTDHRVELTSEQEALRRSLEERFREGGLVPPEEEEVLSGQGGGDDPRRVLQYLLDRGLLVRLKGGHLFHRDVLEALERRVREGPGEFTVPEFKERTGTTRKHAIPLLEYLDGRSVTLRVGDVRRVMNASATGTASNPGSPR